MKNTTKTAPSPSTSKVKITKDFVASIKATGQRQVYRDTEARGLLLRVNADGSKAWYFDYRDPEGKRQSFKIGDADRLDPGEARKKLKTLGEDPAAALRATKARVAQTQVEAAQAESRTLRKFVEGRYWDEHLRLARSGLDTKKRIIAAWEPLMDIDMAALDVKDAVDHRSERIEDEKSPQTLNRDRAALLGMLNRAVEWALIDKNPLDVPAFKPLKTEDDKRVRYLGMQDEHEDIRDEAGQKVGERKRFIDALDHADTPLYLRQLAILAMNTGLRRGELFKLKWSMVSVSDARITVAAATAKSKKTRHIALNTKALAVLQELAKVKHISGFVFVSHRPRDDAKEGEMLPFTTIKKSWTALEARAQLEDFHFHDLRHDFASRLVQAGVNLYEVKEMLGHSSITLTERYAHLAPHQQRRAVALLEAAA